MIDMKKYEEAAAKLKALAHPHRLCIVNGLLGNKCNVSRMQECLGLPQSTISQHLSKLRTAGIIKGERKGLEICYSVCDKQVDAMVKAILHSSLQ